MCIGCMTAAAVMGTVPVFIFDSACRVRIAGCRSTNEVPLKRAPSFVIVWRAVAEGITPA